MHIGMIKLDPLHSKHYTTDITVHVNGNSWDDMGLPFRISISGTGTSPSTREYEQGYDAEYGMDHVESKEHYGLAKIILEALRKAT